MLTQIQLKSCSLMKYGNKRRHYKKAHFCQAGAKPLEQQLIRLQKEKIVIKNRLSDHEATVNKNRIGHDEH